MAWKKNYFQSKLGIYFNNKKYFYKYSFKKLIDFVKQNVFRVIKP